jgi:hypothetical protein
MCNCVNVRIQSYSNQTVLDYPEWFKSSKKVRAAGIDNCILEEIKSLWEAGIQTLESCCGHNQADGYICVVEEHIEDMIDARTQTDAGGIFSSLKPCKIDEYETSMRSNILSFLPTYLWGHARYL